MKVILLIMSHSTDDNLNKKIELISKTYLNVNLNPEIDLEVYFITGNEKNKNYVIKDVPSRYIKPTDITKWFILEVPTKDDYYSLTKKVILSFKYFKNIKDDDLIIKIDDDVYLDINKFISKLPDKKCIPNSYFGRINYISYYWKKLYSPQIKLESTGLEPLDREKEILLEVENMNEKMLKNIVMRARLWHVDFVDLSNTPVDETDLPIIYKKNFENLYCSGACYSIGGKLLKKINKLPMPSNDEFYEDKYIGDCVSKLGGQLCKLDNNLYYDFQMKRTNITNLKFKELKKSVFMHCDNTRKSSFTSNFHLSHYIKVNEQNLENELWDSIDNETQPDCFDENNNMFTIYLQKLLSNNSPDKNCNRQQYCKRKKCKKCCPN